MKFLWVLILIRNLKDLLLLSDINDNDSDNEESSSDTWIAGDRVPTELNFSGSSGIQAPIPDNPEIIDFVKLFFNDSDFEVLTTETNRYAKSYLENATLRQFSRLKRWPAEGITVSDMKCFIACTIAMGLTVQEDLADYWSTDPVNVDPVLP